jgi:IPT/TIG domain
MNTQPLSNAKVKHSLPLVILTLPIIFFQFPSPASRAAELLTTELDNMVTLQESRPLVARTGAWQTFNDHIHLKPGQEKRSLVLTFINGADGRGKLTDLHVLLSQKPFATIKDFNGTDSFSRKLTGTIRPGNLLLTVQVFGTSGARLIWKLSTEKVIVNAVKPNLFSLADKVTVQGKNFSENAQANQVLIANKPVQVKTAKSDELELKLPSHLPSGAQDLYVVADSVKSNTFKVTVKEKPKVRWVDFLATSPGQPVVISGNNFSRVPSENIVTFGSIKARVISANETSIRCIVPDMHFPKWHVPITVTTNGMTSKERVTINIDQRVIPNLGHPML